MPGHTFEHNHFSREILKLLLAIEVIALVIVFSLLEFHYYSTALVISLLMLFVLSSTVLLLYVRYRNIPVVREKNILRLEIYHLRNNIHKTNNSIEVARQRRDSLVQNEQHELDTSLANFQRNFVQKGLENTYVSDATIPGIGPKLKERLLKYNVLTAAHVGENISQIPGFGEMKQQALIGWRNIIFAGFDETKPISLPDEQLKNIRQKYQTLHDENDLTEKEFQASKLNLENVLDPLEEQLKQLVPVTFVNYLSDSLASKKIIAAFLGLLLAVIPIISSVSATTSSIILSIPTATVTFTITASPTQTYTPRITITSTNTFTPTVTYTPTITFTPTRTRTPLPTATSIPTINPLQNVTAICKDGTYSYSAHQQGTCSRHGGVKEWINKPPN